MKRETATSGGTRMTIIHLDTFPAGRPDTFPTGLRHEVDRSLADDGAVLLRGLGIADADAFRLAVTQLSERMLDSYRGGNTPRTRISDGVFTSTEYPPQYEISLHNEMSYACRWPSRVFFCCLVPATTGGATPVCDGRALLTDLPPAVRDRFQRLGVRYQQHMHGGAGFGKSWQQTFETQDRAVVEEFLRDADARFEWTTAGSLRVRQERPGVRRHPVSGELVWFNQADQWHPSNLPDDEAEALLSLVDDEADLPHWVTYGDGTPIPDQHLRQVRATGRRNRLAVPWQAGDLMVIDNMRVLHGREPFTGPRRVVVAMG